MKNQINYRIKEEKMKKQNINSLQEDFKKLLNWLDDDQHDVGSKIILFLLEHPNEKIEAKKLGLLLPERKGKCKQKYSTYQGNNKSFPMIDSKCYFECKSQLKILEKEIKQCLNSDEVKSKQDQYNQIRKYLNSCTTNTGKIRNFPDINNREYHRLYNALKRVYKKMDKTEPDLVIFLKENIKTGYYFEFRIQEINKRRYYE